MGADAKRKEFRKRKFAVLKNDIPAVTVPKVIEAGAIADSSPCEGQDALLAPPLANSAVKDKPNYETFDLSSITDLDQDAAIPKTQRFIVFIGNLPYTATDQSIGNHFLKVQPKSIRHRTEKGGAKSKGFAFLEFDGYDRLKTCLKLYHGSSFDDGISPARKLNVELTAGGGGRKSKERKIKLRVKNERLNEQRLRRVKQERKKQKELKDTQLHERSEAQDQKPEGQGSMVSHEGLPQIPVNNGDIHPSRRDRVAVSAHTNTR